MEVDYFASKITLSEKDVQELQSLVVPYVDKHPVDLSPAELVYNSQMLYKLTTERAAADQAREDAATLKQRILELEADLVKYQKLYFAISRPM